MKDIAGELLFASLPLLPVASEKFIPASAAFSTAKSNVAEGGPPRLMFAASPGSALAAT